MRIAVRRRPVTTSSQLRRRQPLIEQLEQRRLLATPPFSVGGDPSVDPSNFRVTTFASGLNYPKALTMLSDGSLLVGVNNPAGGGSSFYNSSGQLLRLVDTNGDGIADGSPTSLYSNLVGGITAVHQAGEFILVTSTQSPNERITFLRVGSTPAAPLSLVDSIR